MVVTDCWIAVYEEGDRTVRHNHFPADFGCVVYLEAEPGCAPLIFGGKTAHQPTPGSMVMFPGILDHEVPATPGRRVVVAAQSLARLERAIDKRAKRACAASAAAVVSGSAVMPGIRRPSAIAAHRVRPKLRYAVFAGVCAGIEWSLHPFSGSVASSGRVSSGRSRAVPNSA